MERLSVGGVTRTCIRSGVRWELEGRVKWVEWVSMGLGKDALEGKYARVPSQERVLDRGEDKGFHVVNKEIQCTQQSRPVAVQRFLSLVVLLEVLVELRLGVRVGEEMVVSVDGWW